MYKSNVLLGSKIYSKTNIYSLFGSMIVRPTFRITFIVYVSGSGFINHWVFMELPGLNYTVTFQDIIT